MGAAARAVKRLYRGGPVSGGGRISALKDERRDSQAVYVGTAFKF